jgi:acetyl esterase/lipase
MINLNEARNGFEAIGNTYPLAGHVNREDITIAGVSCAWFNPSGASQEDLAIYIHGGGFILGSIQSHAPLVSHIARALQCKVLVINYRLAPEQPFPAGLDDCVAVIEAIGEIYPNVRFGIIGDSAGGNLAIATQLKLKQIGKQAPLYSIVISPWVDLECKNPSYERNRYLDKVLSRPYLVEAAQLYSQGHALSSPLLSPVNGDLREFAPILILCGTHEILQDDSVILHQRFLEAGVTAEIRLFQGELHVWPFMNISSAGSQKALHDIVHFVAIHAPLKTAK